MSKPKYKKAFTLIELLVVIAIIGLLAGAVSVAFSESRKKSRDSKRIQEIKALQSALELHYDSYGFYPRTVNVPGKSNCGGSWPGTSGSWCNSIESASGNNWIKDGALGYSLGAFMQKEPFDPDQGTAAPDSYDDAIFYYSGNYAFCQAGQGYALVFALEQKGTDFEKKFNRVNYIACSDGAPWNVNNNLNDGIVFMATDY